MESNLPVIGNRTGWSEDATDDMESTFMMQTDLKAWRVRDDQVPNIGECPNQDSTRRWGYFLSIPPADADYPSFGCRDKARWTYFGNAFFNVALRQAKT